MMKRRTFLASASAAVAGSSLLHGDFSYAQRASKSSARGGAHRFVHPGILHNLSDLEFIKAKVLGREDPWKTGWDAMLAKPESSLDFTPQPRAHVFRGSYGAGQTGVNELNASEQAAQNHALQWMVTGNEEHAHKCIEILDAWAIVLADFAGNDAMLLAGWTGGSLANAAEILHATFPGWHADAIDRFKRMLRTVYVPLLQGYFPEANGNWDAAIMHSMLAIAVFCEDNALLSSVLHHYRLGNGTAGITRYVYPNGQCEETTRDQAHTQLGLGYFALTARIAGKQGIDLFGEADNRLALGFEYTSRFMLGEAMPVFGSASESSRGRFDDFYEAALEHYRYEKGMAMPFTERAASKARARSGRGALWFHRGQGRFAQPVAAAPVPSGIAGQAGAQISETAAPVNAFRVAPGESIQKALDQAAKSAGSTVYVSAGLHFLDEPLRLPNNITLAGAGRATTLYLNPKQGGAAIIAAAPDLHDVVLRDFVLECGLEEKPSRDPNQDSRPRRSQLAPARGGMALRSDGVVRIRNLRLESVTVLHGTLSAVEIFGADNIQIVNCDFAGSGGAVAPGAGQHNNLRLSRSHGIVVKGTRLADSLCGSGAGVLLCEEVEFTDCEISRNAQDGISILESSGIRVKECLLEGNQGFAIGSGGKSFSPSEFLSTRLNNVLRYNADSANPILRA